MQRILHKAIFMGDWQAATAALSSIDAAMVAHGEQASQYAWREGEIALGRGDAKAALVAADLAIADLATREADLEELFLRQYDGTGAGAGAGTESQ